MRAVALTSARGGIDRTRLKGGAKPDTLYDAVNCWVTVSKSLRPRPGTEIDAALPEGTIGLTTYRDKLVVFSDHAVDISAFPGYQLEILTYPGSDDLENPPTLAVIHFAEPFLGYLYVSAEWSDGSVFHYWLQAVTTWQPNTIYTFNALVQPSVPNGYVYRANRLNPANPQWRPNTAYQLGDIVEPTTPNSYQYEAVEVIGTSPRSGSAEPSWVASDGALINDDADIGEPVPDATGGSGSSTTPPQEIIDRYGLGTDAATQREIQ